MAITTEGFIQTTTPQVIAEGADAGILVIRLLTLYNPNGSAAAFILRKVVDSPDGTERELFIRRFDDEIPSLGTWAIGVAGTPIMIVLPGQRYEVVLDSAPTLGIEWVCDLGRA